MTFSFPYKSKSSLAKNVWGSFPTKIQLFEVGYIVFIIIPCNSKYYSKIASLLHNVFKNKNSYVLNTR